MNTNSLPKSKTVQEWLVKTTAALRAQGIGTARLDALVLLEDATDHNRAYLLAHDETILSPQLQATLKKQVKRRLQHEPLAYIRGKTEFYGREFAIDKHVLEPRPESETMITLLKGSRFPGSETVADIGTGSGALAITTKLELPAVEVIATDIDPFCINVARRNAVSHHTTIKFYTGDLLEPLSALGVKSLTLLCNLPYVPDTYHINQAAAMEPRQAIFGGSDGLDHYRKLFNQIHTAQLNVDQIFTESLPFQHQTLGDIAKASGFKLVKVDDFIQQFSKS